VKGFIVFPSRCRRHGSADLILQSALKRQERRGLHFTLDYPDTDPVARDTVQVP
jgi:L-aspartate oxidase